MRRRIFIVTHLEYNVVKYRDAYKSYKNFKTFTTRKSLSKYLKFLQFYKIDYRLWNKRIK